MERLKHRVDFLAAAGGAKAPVAGFVLQRRDRGDEKPARVGYTVTKRVGNAVERNRMRRRLREIVRLSATAQLREGNDYVLIARRAALALPFTRLAEDLSGALGRVHAPNGGARGDKRAG
jgi:ribonuclease P protein component